MEQHSNKEERGCLEDKARTPSGNEITQKASNIRNFFSPESTVVSDKANFCEGNTHDQSIVKEKTKRVRSASVGAPPEHHDNLKSPSVTAKTSSNFKLPQTP